MHALKTRAAWRSLAVFAAMAALAAAAFIACRGPERVSGPSAPPPTPVIRTIDVQGPTGFARTNMTFYAGYDNDPAGSTEIAYANQRHAAAGGNGTFADPLTFATDPNELPPGTTIYYAPLRKYFVMEDQCAECMDDWKTSKRPHIDLWMSATTDPRVLECEEMLTPDGLVTIEINPPAGRDVDTRPLFDSTGHCWSSSPAR